jgi:DNA-binding NtrC family response regulator
VDDEEQVRTTTARVLERFGYNVIQAGSAEQALALADTTSFHLLLMDVVLPQMSGLSLAHKIAALRPEIRILYFSAYTSDEILEDQFEKRPGVGFIRKPFTAGAMARAVRDLLDESVSKPSRPEPTSGGTESILVVDDDPQTRRFMAKSLERLGYHILEAQDPDRAVPIALKSNLDLVVADVVLPGMSGPAMARVVAAAKPELRYLFVSGKGPAETALERSVGDPQAAFLMKPFSPNDLGEAVRKALDVPPEKSRLVD